MSTIPIKNNCNIMYAYVIANNYTTTISTTITFYIPVALDFLKHV